MDINLLLILIRQMAALARRALAEVCTVPVLLVVYVYNAVSHVLISSLDFTAIVILLCNDALLRVVVKQAMLILISRSTREVTARIRKSSRTSTYEALRARVA